MGIYGGGGGGGRGGGGTGAWGGGTQVEEPLYRARFGRGGAAAGVGAAATQRAGGAKLVEGEAALFELGGIGLDDHGVVEQLGTIGGGAGCRFGGINGERLRLRGRGGAQIGDVQNQ